MEWRPSLGGRHLTVVACIWRFARLYAEENCTRSWQTLIGVAVSCWWRHERQLNHHGQEIVKRTKLADQRLLSAMYPLCRKKQGLAGSDKTTPASAMRSGGRPHKRHSAPVQVLIWSSQPLEAASSIGSSRQGKAAGRGGQNGLVTTILLPHAHTFTRRQTLSYTPSHSLVSDRIVYPGI